LDTMDADVQTLSSFAADYVIRLPTELAEGNVFAVSLVLILSYIAILIINKLTGIIIFLMKKLFLLSIVMLSFYRFMADLIIRVAADGPTTDNIIFGAGGFLVGFIAFVIALYAALSSLKDIHRSKTEEKEETKEKDETKEKEETEEKEKTEDAPAHTPKMFSMDSLKDDKNLGAVLTYLVIAQFGVFSSKTIAAPNETVGMGFFGVFLVAAFIFIHQSYRDYKRGLVHFAIALVLGGGLSLLLGHFWGNIPQEILLSPAYFSTDSLVALVTGLSVSLFMGSKG